MKKVIVSVCLLYAANGCAMGVGKVIGLATAPITVPGAYYAYQTIAGREKIRQEMQGQSSRDIEREVACVNPIADYVDGVFQGIAPGINLAKLAGCSTVGHRGVDQMYPVEKVGFFAGLSSWPSMIGAYIYLLKRIK